MSEATTKTLEIGQDYACYLPIGAECKCIYLGGNLWRQEMAGRPSREAESAKMVALATECLNRAAVGNGIR